MPPCAAMPLTAPPMPCSRTPKKTLRPAFSAVKRSESGNSVFVDSVRSAAPPTIVGVNGSNAAMTFAPALRVAILALSLQSMPRSASAEAGQRPCPTQARSHSSASSGFAVAPGVEALVPLGVRARRRPRFIEAAS